MDPIGVQVPAVLRERLGEEASGELGELIGRAGQRWREDVLELATERFGKMLAEEGGKIRVEIANLRAELKGDIAALRAELKGDIAALRADVKGDIAGLMKWSFVFWVGQTAVILGLVAFALR